jgi:hypothetical protein
MEIAPYGGVTQETKIRKPSSRIWFDRVVEGDGLLVEFALRSRIYRVS